MGRMVKKNWLNRMKEEGQISQHGKGKYTFYILKEKKWLFTSLYL